MQMITGSLIVLLLVLTGVVGALFAWQRWHRRCVRCAKAIPRRFPYCPWCAQMQFSKTRTPGTRTPVLGEQQRRRASLPTGERLALLLRRKKATQGKGTSPTRAAAGTIVLSQGSKATRIARAPEPTMRDTTVRTTLTSLASCPKCGHRIEGVETFCGQCGFSLSEGPLSQKERT